MYRYKRLRTKEAPTEEELNKLAEEGWELLQVIPGDNFDDWYSYFRQPFDAAIVSA
jgi:hypothetical protein